MSRSIFALVDDCDRAYFGGRGGDEQDQIGYIDANTRAIFGRSYAAEPGALVKQLAADEAIAAADTLLLTVPNQLGVAYNAHALESIHGVTSKALQAYDRKLCAEISAVVLRNRGAGPFGLLNLLDERCGGVFDDIHAVIPPREREDFMSRYRIAAGFEKDRLNAAPSIIAPGAKVAAA